MAADLQIGSFSPLAGRITRSALAERLPLTSVGSANSLHSVRRSTRAALLEKSVKNAPKTDRPPMVGPIKHKVCATCGEELPLEAFVKCHKNTHSRTPYCMSCARATSRKWDAEHPERVKELAKAHRTRNAESIKASAARYRAENRDLLRQKSREAYAKWAPQERKKYYQERYYRNREKIAARTARWGARNRDRVLERGRRWSKRNPHKIAAKCSRRRARTSAMAWADKAAISEVYKKARELTVATGVPHEVDHVFPLNSDKVCGLHVEGNLQVLTAYENRSKGNRVGPGVDHD